MSIVKLHLSHDATPIETPKQTLLTLVVPVYNEESAIGPFLEATATVRDRLAPLIRCEILFINDGSRDATEFAIRSFMQNNPAIRLVNLSRNFGKEAALCAGLEHARGDAVIPVDVDLQDDLSVIPEMIDKWRQGAAIVNARRSDRTSDTWAKRTSARVFYRPSTRCRTIRCHLTWAISAFWTGRSSTCSARWESGCA